MTGGEQATRRMRNTPPPLQTGGLKRAGSVHQSSVTQQRRRWRCAPASSVRGVCGHLRDVEYSHRVEALSDGQVVRSACPQRKQRVRGKRSLKESELEGSEMTQL